MTVLLFSYHAASFTLTPAASLNKKWMSGECLFTHLSMQHSFPLLTPNSFSPAQRSQKRQTPAVDLAHVLGLIRIVVPWWRGAARLARGACRHEACQRAFKEPGPRKGKQMAAGNYPTHALHLFPPASPSHHSYSTSVQRTLWGLWSGRMPQCWACPRSLTSQGPCWLLCNTNTLFFFYTNSRAQFMFTTLRKTSNWQTNKKKNCRRERQQEQKTMTLTNCRKHYETSQAFCFFKKKKTCPELWAWLFWSNTIIFFWGQSIYF